MRTLLPPIEKPGSFGMKLAYYNKSFLFTAAERSVLDYAKEWTIEKKIKPETFAQMADHFSEREICEIVYLVASEHLYNLTNIGLNIHSDMLGDIVARMSLRSGINFLLKVALLRNYMSNSLKASAMCVPLGKEFVFN